MTTSALVTRSSASAEFTSGHVLRWLGKNYWQLIGAILTCIGLVIAYIKLGSPSTH
jgi:hypothetical protein